MKQIFAIVGSTRKNSSNLKLVRKFEALTKEKYKLIIFEGIGELPHFNPDIDNANPPEQIVAFRQKIAGADGILICTPEYIFSLPGSLKNAIEWCVSTMVFSHKPAGLITASADGKMGHDQLKLIMKTVEAKFTDETTLLIHGIKGKFDANGNLSDTETIGRLNRFVIGFDNLLNE